MDNNQDIKNAVFFLLVIIQLQFDVIRDMNGSHLQYSSIEYKNVFSKINAQLFGNYVKYQTDVNTLGNRLKNLNDNQKEALVLLLASKTKEDFQRHSLTTDAYFRKLRICV